MPMNNKANHIYQMHLEKHLQEENAYRSPTRSVVQYRHTKPIVVAHPSKRSTFNCSPLINANGEPIEPACSLSIHIDPG